MFWWATYFQRSYLQNEEYDSYLNKFAVRSWERRCYSCLCDKPQVDTYECLLLTRYIHPCSWVKICFQRWTSSEGALFFKFYLPTISIVVFLRFCQMLLNLKRIFCIWGEVNFWVVFSFDHVCNVSALFLKIFFYFILPSDGKVLLDQHKSLCSWLEWCHRGLSGERGSDTGLTTSCLWTPQILQRIWHWAEWFWLYEDSVAFLFLLLDRKSVV